MKNLIYKLITNVIYFKFINKILNLYSIKKAKINYAKYPLIFGKLFLKNRGEIFFGKNIIINSGKNYNTIGGDTRTIIDVKRNGVLKIGSNVGISNSTLSCFKCIIIEDDVLIGGSCKIYDSDFHSLSYIERMKPYKDNKPDKNVKSLEVKIKKGAWIGGHCIILKGVSVGEQSVIAAGSVLTKSVPSNELWGGNPAKFIKKIN